MVVWDALRDKLAEKPWPATVLALLAVLFLATWFFGWNKPSRSDVESFLVYAFTLEKSLEAFGDDGTEHTIEKSTVASIGTVDCHGESKRRQPSVTYYCFYTLTGTSGAQYRLVLVAVYNRGWKRMGMASVGNYRLSTLSAKTQRDIFSRYDDDLPAGSAQGETGDS